jgi:hypothetical protein
MLETAEGRSLEDQDRVFCAGRTPAERLRRRRMTAESRFAKPTKGTLFAGKTVLTIGSGLAVGKKSQEEIDVTSTVIDSQ